MNALSLSLVMVLGLLLAACSQDSSLTGTPSGLPSAEPKFRPSPKAVPPGPVTSVSPTQPPTPTPAPPPRTRPPTGVADVDAAVAAIESRDVAGLLAVMRYELQSCGPGGTAICAPGSSPGTIVEAFLSTGCEGDWRTRSQAENALEHWLRGVDYVYGAYRWFGRSDTFWGRAGFFVVVSAVGPDGGKWARHIYFPEDPARGTWISSGCLSAVEEHLIGLAERGTLIPMGTVVPP